MKRAISVIILFLIPFVSIIAQSNDAKTASNFWDRVYIGGDVSLNFGNVTVIGATPIIGYRISEKLSAGVGGTYLYFSQNIQGFGRYSTSIYGGNVFGRYLITEQIIAQTEYHILNVEAYDFASNSLGRTNVPIWYVGGGYRARISNNSFIILMALFDLIEDPNSPYANPQIRGGVSIGL